MWMFKGGSYNNMDEFVDDINAKVAEGYALHSWQAHNGLGTGGKATKVGPIFEKVNYYSAVYVKAAEQPKPQGMKAR
jgi:hypothetical protein